MKEQSVFGIGRAATTRNKYRTSDGQDSVEPDPHRLPLMGDGAKQLAACFPKAFFQSDASRVLKHNGTLVGGGDHF